MFFWTLVVLALLVSSVYPPLRKFVGQCVYLALIAWGAIMVLSFIG